MVRSPCNLAEIAVDIIHITDKAVLVSDGDKEVWLPLSHTEIEDNRNGTGIVIIPEWLAIKEGLV